MMIAIASSSRSIFSRINQRATLWCHLSRSISSNPHSDVSEDLEQPSAEQIKRKRKAEWKRKQSVCPIVLEVLSANLYPKYLLRATFWTTSSSKLKEVKANSHFIITLHPNLTLRVRIKLTQIFFNRPRWGWLCRIPPRKVQTIRPALRREWCSRR